MKYAGLIVGLGNPGSRYARTRHNYGFMLADRLVSCLAGTPGYACVEQRTRLNAQIWEGSDGNGCWLVLKPLTFMNLSGQVVGPLARKHGLESGQILVLHDELDLPLGTARFKFAGGLAGHNGLKSIAACLGTRDFSRLRLGIGRPVDADNVADYVLRSFLPDQWPQVEQTLDRALDGVQEYCRLGLTAAMNRLHSG